MSMASLLRMRRDRHRGAAAACLLAVLISTRVASGDGAPTAEDQALATTLFREAKTLLDAGKVAEACRKLEESQRLDPGGGTLLNLAVCHEREGRIATAWAEFRQARGIAERDHRVDRIELADAHAKALEPRLSKLTIEVAPAVQLADMEILVDHRVLRRPAWASAVPLDPGEHAIEARAPGKKSWLTQVRLLPDADAKTVSIPPWEDDAPSSSALLGTAPAAPTAQTEAATARDRQLPARDRRPAIIVGGAGVAAIVVGSIFGGRAIKKHDDSAAACIANPCGADSVSANDASKTAADTSTVLFAAGLLSLGVGAYLWFSGSDNATIPRAVRITPFGLAGSF